MYSDKNEIKQVIF